MKVSVAMTTYNGEKYITKQLESLLNQSMTIDEVVICDDGSNDKTLEIVEKFIAEHNLTMWQLKKNPQQLGFVENFRQAISLTNGDIVFLADQDDDWKLNKIEVLTSEMQKNPNMNVIMTSVDFIDGDGKAISLNNNNRWCKRMVNTPRGTLQRVDYIQLCSGNFAPGCTLCMRRSIADEYVNFDNKISIPHDWLICLLAARKNSCYMLFEPLINYRLHANNTIGISEKKKKSYDNDLRWLNGICNRIEMGINSDYENNEQLKNNLTYSISRKKLYENKSLKGLLKVFWNSRKAKNVTESVLKTNCRDFLFYIGRLYKE